MQRALTSGPITGSILLGLCMGSSVFFAMQWPSKIEVRNVIKV